jgi:hypothetical protein
MAFHAIETREMRKQRLLVGPLTKLHGLLSVEIKEPLPVHKPGRRRFRAARIDGHKGRDSGSEQTNRTKFSK